MTPRLILWNQEVFKVQMCFFQISVIRNVAFKLSYSKTLMDIEKIQFNLLIVSRFLKLEFAFFSWHCNNSFIVKILRQSTLSHGLTVISTWCFFLFRLYKISGILKRIQWEEKFNYFNDPYATTYIKFVQKFSIFLRHVSRDMSLWNFIQMGGPSVL